MAQEKSWYKVEVNADAEASEAIESALSELGALGTEIDLLGKDKQTEVISIIGYFDELPDAELLQSELHKWADNYGFGNDAIKNISSDGFENRDWLAEWKKHWRPTETKKFIIAPMWENVEDDQKFVIRIEPSMAFGTGTHETTRLCLKAIEENYTGDSFLDVGTGTGILAIAAAKMARRGTKIIACDIDTDSIKIAKENAYINGARDIEFYEGTINSMTPQCEFVCANLTADVILPILPLLVKKAAKILILSGILKEQEHLVTSALKKYPVARVSVQTEGEWIAIIVNK